MRPWFVVPGDWRHPTRAREFDVLTCTDCAFGRVFPVPAPEILADHYRIEQYYTHGSDQETRRGGLFERIRVKIAGYLVRGIRDRAELALSWAPPAPAGILEIGCGGGDLLRRFQQHGYDVMGVEPDHEARSRQVGFPAPVFSGTAEEPPPEVAARKFDYVIMTHVIEHCTDPIRVVENLRALLNKCWSKRQIRTALISGLAS